MTRLLQISPGVNFDAFPRAAPRPSFRGIGGSNQGAGADPSSVGFLDGIYLRRSAMLEIDFFDLERVKVLKGPQGTLFGKNVVGGAIKPITARPRGEAEASVELTAGEYGQRDGHIMLNLPVTKRTEGIDVAAAGTAANKPVRADKNIRVNKAMHPVAGVQGRLAGGAEPVQGRPVNAVRRR